MYVVFLKITTFLLIILIFHPGYTSLILETNCNDKIWWNKGLNANIWGRGPRKTNTLFPVKLMQLKNVIKETVHSVNNTTENNDSYDDKEFRTREEFQKM